MKLFVALALLGSLAVASAQPFNFTGFFAPRIGEVAQRHAVNYTGFVFDFKTAKVGRHAGATPDALPVACGVRLEA